MYSENNLVSLKSSILYIRFIFFIFAYDFIIKNLNNFSKINLNAISFCFIALFIDANFQYFYGSNILGFKAHLETSRISSFFGDEAIMGSFISKILPIFITLIFICYKKFNSILLFFIFFFLFLLVILSGERAAIAHLFIYSSIFLTLANFENKKKILTILITFVTILILLIVNFDSKKNHRIFMSTFYQIKDGNFISHYHEKHFETAFNMFKDKPIIGHGPKSFRFKCKQFSSTKGSCTTHPHNTYLQLLAETGVFGFLFVFSFFILLLYMLIKSAYLKFFKSVIFLENSKLSIVTGLFTFLFPISSNGNFFNNWLSIMLFLQLSLFYYLINQNRL